MAASGGDLSWYFSQVKGTLDDDVAEGNLYKPFQHIKSSGTSSNGIKNKENSFHSKLKIDYACFIKTHSWNRDNFEKRAYLKLFKKIKTIF